MNWQILTTRVSGEEQKRRSLGMDGARQMMLEEEKGK
jgi:hypothetical protein